MTLVLSCLAVATLIELILLALLLYRSASDPVAAIVREELRRSRDDSTKVAREHRDELAQNMKSATETLVKIVGELGSLQHGQLDGFSVQLGAFCDSTHTRLDGIRSVIDSQLTEMRNANDTKLGDIRTTLESSLRLSADESANAAQALRDEVTKQLTAFQDSTVIRYEAMRHTVDHTLKTTQEQSGTASRALREELTATLKGNADSVIKSIGEMGSLQNTTLEGVGKQVKDLTDTTQSRLDALRNAVEVQLKDMQESNAKKLDEIRRTVDEQLQTTLEKRLTESFMVVSGHLESVQRGLGEMQALATGVGDLKRVLTNVKARGTWAEYQLGAILDEVLTPEQYEKNVRLREDSLERVEFAVRLPGRNNDPTTPVWLPIDSKFPQESYVRLMDAADHSDMVSVQAAITELARNVRGRAQEIHDKYLAPPNTTEFGILFLPTEGLYAEILRIPNLVSELQQRFKIMVAGPTTLAALLSSLRMGFQTLVIEQRASEVWRVLGAVKGEFHKFGDVLAKLRRQLDLATRTIDDTDKRTRAMNRKLRDVEELPGKIGAELLRLPETIESLEEEDELEVPLEIIVSKAV